MAKRPILKEQTDFISAIFFNKNMEIKRNYQKELENIIEENKKRGIKPTLLLHACCAPCSSYCLYYLSEYFDITVFFYNPNIYPLEEYKEREAEIRRLISEMFPNGEVKYIEGKYECDDFFKIAQGLEDLPEGYKRCENCFELRLFETAKLSKKMGFDYFTTTLSISPLKNAKILNDVCEKAASLYGIKNLPSDFKKKNGYKMSIELSKKYNLYRQNYCGCIYSKR